MQTGRVTGKLLCDRQGPRGQPGAAAGAWAGPVPSGRRGNVGPTSSPKAPSQLWFPETGSRRAESGPWKLPCPEDRVGGERGRPVQITAGGARVGGSRGLGQPLRDAPN